MSTPQNLVKYKFPAGTGGSKSLNFQDVPWTDPNSACLRLGRYRKDSAKQCSQAVSPPFFKIQLMVRTRSGISGHDQHDQSEMARLIYKAWNKSKQCSNVGKKMHQAYGSARCPYRHPRHQWYRLVTMAYSATTRITETNRSAGRCTRVSGKNFGSYARPTFVQ